MVQHIEVGQKQSWTSLVKKVIRGAFGLLIAGIFVASVIVIVVLTLAALGY